MMSCRSETILMIVCFLACLGANLSARGGISGSVKLLGEPRNPDERVNIGRNDFCGQHGEIQTENWISREGGLGNVVISIIGATSPERSSARPLIDQVNCRYTPHVTAIRAGDTVMIRNSDATYHNIRFVRHQDGTLNKGKNIRNLAQARKGMSHAHEFDQSGIYRIECDVHRWMRCWVFVHDNAYFAISQEDGQFEITTPIADGDYKIRAWHSQFREPLVQSISIVEGEAKVSFEFDAAKAL